MKQVKPKKGSQSGFAQHWIRRGSVFCALLLLLVSASACIADPPRKRSYTQRLRDVVMYADFLGEVELIRELPKEDYLMIMGEEAISYNKIYEVRLLYDYYRDIPLDEIIYMNETLRGNAGDRKVIFLSKHPDAPCWMESSRFLVGEGIFDVQDTVDGKFLYKRGEPFRDDDGFPAEEVMTEEEKNR